MLVTAIVGVLAACADSELIGPEIGPDGATVIPPPEGAPEDASAEAPFDSGADVDAATPICSADGFCHSVLPDGQSLNGVWGDGAGTVWSVSSTGNILRWDGSSWTIHYHTEAEAYSIWGSGPTDVWVGTAAGLLHGVGATAAQLIFSPVADLPGDPRVPLRSIWGTGPADIWAVGMMEDWEVWPPWVSRVIHFSGEQAGWEEDGEAISLGVAARAIWGSPATGVWMDGLQLDEWGYVLRVFRRTPGADTWSPVDLPSGSMFGMYGVGMTGAGLSSDSLVMLSGVLGSPEESAKATWVGTSSDNGQTFDWTFTPQEPWRREFLAYWGTAPNDAWGVGTSGMVSHWNGTTWTQAVVRVTDIPVGKTFRAIWGTSTADFWVVGDEIALHKTNEGKP